ncbi:MAG: D-alanyl-D-alanine carboxypeptidase [Actinomycetota bacterium]|nr:D-alanyl-D-alanine carboxypeptidase [Actinomycetota bacterium]
MHRLRLVAPLLLGCALLSGISGTAAAAPGQPIGGPALGTTGTVTATGTRPVPATVTAASFVVADLDSGAVYAARNPHLHSLPASTLKTLTALVLLPQLKPSTVLVGSQADADVDGTRVGIVSGGRYTVEQLFQALLMMSGNDAAELLARANGSRAVTLDQMNAKAAELQAFDTHAATPSGLDGPGQSISAYDLALINRATMTMPAFRRYISMRRSTFGAAGGLHFAIENKNRLFRIGYPGAIGIKDGFTDAAQHTYVGAATRGGHTYIVTLVRADRTYWQQAAALLDWAFALPATAQPVGELVDPVKLGAEAHASPQPPPQAHLAAGSGPGWLRDRGTRLTALGAAVSVLIAMSVLARRGQLRRRRRLRLPAG